MSSTALAMVLIAAVLHASWNLTAKRVTGSAFTFIFCHMALSGLVSLPLGVWQWWQAGAPLTWPILVGPAVSGVLHIGYAMALQRGYQQAPLGVVYPVARGVGPLLSMVVALTVFGERPGWLAVAGGALVLVGIMIVIGGGFRTRDRSTMTGFAYGTATGIAIAAYTLWDAHAVTSWAVPPATMFSFGFALQILMLTPGQLGRRAELGPTIRTWWREIVAVSVLAPAAYILVLTALQTTPVAIVAPLRESSIIIGSLVAWWLFKESDPVRRVIGAVVVLGGIALIST